MTREPVTTETPERRNTPALSSAPGYMLMRKCSCGGSSPSGVSDEPCEECGGKAVQMSRSPSGQQSPIAVPRSVHKALASSGHSLDGATRGVAESHLGHDFSRVRIHSDSVAGESARAVNALAYTVGDQIVFGQGQYQPGTSAGNRLLMHELVHVVQQSSASKTNDELAVEPADTACEREADRVAHNIVRSGP
jgi:hypothetical protein